MKGVKKHPFYFFKCETHTHNLLQFFPIGTIGIVKYNLIDNMSVEPDYVWQDRELRFDSPEMQLQCRSGEKIIDSINSVEDTKGTDCNVRIARMTAGRDYLWCS